MVRDLSMDVVRRVYPSETAALSASVRSPLGVARSIQHIFDDNALFLRRLRDDGFRLSDVAKLLGSMIGEPVRPTTVGSCFARIRVARTASGQSSTQEFAVSCTSLQSAALPSIKVQKSARSENNQIYHENGVPLRSWSTRTSPKPSTLDPWQRAKALKVALERAEND